MKKTNRSQLRQSGKRAQVFKSKANLGSARLRAIPFALALVFGSTSSFADPMGGEVVAGYGAISAANGITTIQQTSDRAIVNWQSFNVNAGEAVKFMQPSSTAAILNRVTGGSVSTINGLVEGNGRVYLINPNGIVVGANGVVNVNGGFVASTKSLADSAFMSGGALVFTGESTGSIQILGKVQSAQGDVILIAPKIAIEKTGSLIAGQTIKLVAANEVELSNGKFTVKPKAGDAGQLTIEGALEAAKVLLAANNNNLGALAINTTGTIRATGTQTNPDGSVSIIATGEGGNINISGNIRSEKGDGNGGAVTVLADNNIRVSGTINANSSDISKVGGDIYIGRDITTNKLARATDVGGATLLSNKGFVETSGDWLKTNKITVLAKDWLLDPTNIRIVADANASSTVADAPQTNVGGVNTFQNNAGINGSEVLKSTIVTAINAGTSVTISTRNTTSGANGSGNITLETALDFNNTGAQDATFKLDAVNGITQNAGATITAVGSKNVNIEMLAEGKHLGVTPTIGATNNNSNGIVLNAAIKTNGSVKMDGTSFNTNVNRRGIDFNSGSSIEAASFDIKGQAHAAAQGTHGVQINGNTSFKSTGTGISTINGTSLTTSTGITAGTNLNGTNIKFNAAGTGGSIVVTGSNANTGLGVRISAIGDNTTVTTDGNVTFGELGVPNSAFSMRAGSITANSGSLNILGSAVSNFGGESITANNGVSINIEGKTTAGSASNAVAFANIAIKALQGTFTSAGNINITGTSSTGNAINLQPSVSIEGRDVTLNGTAANGTLASGAAINGSGKITASGTLKIEGVSANTGGYTTITNGPLQAAGDITIKGTGTAKHGVNLGNNVAGNNITSTGGKIEVLGTTNGAGGIGGSASGSAVNGNAVITADKDVTITGKTHGYYAINGLGNITSNNGNVTIDGYSRDSRGVNYDKTITANNGLIKVIGGSGVDGTVTSTATGAGSEHGVYFSGLAKAKNVTIEGASKNSVGTFVGSVSGTNIDATEKVTIKGTSTGSTGVNLGSPNGNSAFNATIKSGGDTSVTGTGVTGVRVWAGSSIDAKNIDVIGTSVTRTAGESGIGVDFERIVNTAKFTSSENINIEGNLTGAGVGSGVKTSWRNQNGNAPTMNAGDNFTLRANNRATNINNTNAAINADSGIQVTAGKNIVVQAETNNENARAMSFFSTGDNYRGNTSFVSTGGDVLIQANQGAIVFNNLQNNTAAGQSTDIKGRNITFDNTGAGMATGVGSMVGSGGTKGGTIGSGSINTDTGVMVAGTGKAFTEAINFAQGRVVNATGQLNIMGASKTAVGVQIFTELTGGSVNIQGTSENAGGIYNTRKIESTTGAVSMIGRSTTATGHSGITIQGEVKGKTDINLEGYSANTNNMQGIIIGDKVTAETGTIKVTGETKAANQRAVAITQLGSKFGSLNTTNKDITVIGNTLLIATGTPGATVNAGTGTVFIKTLTAGNEIVLGAEDAMNTSLNNQKLGIDNAELARITSAKLVIGDNAAAVNNGKITVGTSSETFSAASNGNVVLQTKGDIEIAHKLTIASGKTLTLNAGGSVTDNDTNGIIKADKLELLGDGAFNLDNKKQTVGTLAANVKSLVFTNATQLNVGEFNGTTGVTAKDGVRVTTETGNLFIDKAISNTVSGDVVVGAGVSEAAGLTALGDVKTTPGQAISTQAGGKTLVYTGSAAGSGLLSNLNAALGDLKVTVDATQNTDTFRAFDPANPSAGISGSTETAQVMFREKVTITNGLVGTTLEKTYGDANTKNTATAALLTETIAKLKQEGGNLGTLTGTSANYTTPSTGSGNVIKIAKSVIIDSLTGNLDGAAYSDAQYLKANGTYAYNTDSNKLTSAKYTLVDGTFTAPVKVTVAQKALTGSITPGSSIYGESLALGSAGTLGTINGLVVGDKVDAGASTVVLGYTNTSTSGNLKAGKHTQTLTGLSGADASNYSFANVKGDYTVSKKAITADNLNTTLAFTGALLTQNTPTLNDLLSNPSSIKDNVSIVPSSLAKGTVAGVYTSPLSIEGGDAANYDLVPVFGRLTIDFNNVTPPTPPQLYVPIVSDIVNLAPVSFAVGVAPATAAGDEADPNICYAWGQRNGGDMVVHTVLKATYLGLRTAKTDTQEAMSNSGGSSSHAANPCGNDAATKVADAGKL